MFDSKMVKKHWLFNQIIFHTTDVIKPRASVPSLVMSGDAILLSVEVLGRMSKYMYFVQAII